VRLRHFGILMYIASVNSTLDSGSIKATCFGPVTRIYKGVYNTTAVPGDRVWSEVSVWVASSWDCEFESRREHGCVSVVSVV